MSSTAVKEPVARRTVHAVRRGGKAQPRAADDHRRSGSGPHPFAARLRSELLAALTGSGDGRGLPIPELIDIVVQYALLVPLTSLIAAGNRTGHMGASPKPTAKGGGLNVPRDCCVWRDRVTGIEYLLVADRWNHSIVKLSLDTYTLSTVAGTGTSGYVDGDMSSAKFVYTYGVAVVPSDNSILVTESGGNRVRRIYAATTGVVETVATGGGDALFSHPTGIVCATDSKFCVVADRGNNRFCRIELESKAITVVGMNTGTDTKTKTASADLPQPVAVAWDVFAKPPKEELTAAAAVDRFVYALCGRSLERIDLATRASTPIRLAESGGGRSFESILVLSASRVLLSCASSCLVYVLDVASGQLAAFVGSVQGRSLDPVASTIGAAGGVISRGTPARQVELRWPTGLALVPAERSRDGVDRLFVCDSNNSLVRVVSGSVTTLACGDDVLTSTSTDETFAMPG